ncbi:hypothetical protein A3770_06p44330 [Chloropicon primus]|uniref:Uncharacterized protein n=1 Tax=Chloropicon primus TaxID=1764295 RepID=A0A5B8MQM2_9CHLO|nr:hypothetical protein A3770_06p44330 [Chloropicon primus]|eukprot:QDZ21915.1 hypothetical protein A3770_06p44330 [Chloropicon primus]
MVTIEEVVEDTTALEERLREKYAGNMVDTGSAPRSAPGAQVSGCRGAEEPERSNGLHVHLCHVCKGEGSIKMNYNARVIDQNCDECEGVGTITTKNGVKISEEEATSIRREASRGDPADDKTEEDIQKLEKMVEKYEKEIEGLEAALADSEGEKRKLHEDVLSQVRVMLERSKGALNFKKNRKDRLARQKERQLKDRIAENLREGARRKSKDSAESQK